VTTKPNNGFLGTYYISLDEKGRINIPAKFKAVAEQESNSNMVICVMNQFLTVFPQNEWAMNEEKLNNLSAFNLEDRNRLREFYSRAAECELKSGKILIPSNQREIAGLIKDVVLVGMSKTFEIWATDRWEKFAANR
jgi:MraZ protein